MSNALLEISDSVREHLHAIELSLPNMIRNQGEESAIDFLEDLKCHHSFSLNEHWSELIDATIVEVENGDYS